MKEDAEVGEQASERRTSLSVNELHFQIGGTAAEPVGSTPSHHLSDGWRGGGGGQGGLMALAPAFLMDVFVSERLPARPL